MGLDAAATRRGWLVVLPEGIRDATGKRSWSATAACCGEVRPEADDLAYLHGVLVDAGRRAAIDPRRVYAIGSSNGGFMAQRWACSPAAELRAVVSVSGAGPGPADPPCAPRFPVSVLEVHGDDDRIVHYEGGTKRGARYPSAHATAESWRAIDGCGGDPALSLRGGLPLRVRVESWPCESARVELWTIETAGHDIPGVRAMTGDWLDFLETAP
jgi:polyhydroxybutyrate depolymerase